MMKVTGVRAIAAACFSHVALAEADQFPSKSVLDDPNWVKTCEHLRSYISSRPYVDLTYTGTMDLVALGNQQVSVDGFQVGIPFLPSASVEVRTYDHGVVLDARGDRDEYIVIESKAKTFQDNYWDAEDVIGHSKPVFGEKISFEQLYIDGYKFVSGDVTCRVETKNSDIKKLAVLYLKQFMIIQGAKIDKVFAVEADGIEGYTYCYKDLDMSYVRLVAVSDSQVIDGTIRMHESCDRLFR